MDEMPYNERLEFAVNCFRDRRDGRPSIPPVDGYFCPTGWWVPSDTERRPCCNGRWVPADRPYILRNHVDSLKHVAHIFDVTWIDLKRAVAARDKFAPNHPSRILAI